MVEQHDGKGRHPLGITEPMESLLVLVDVVSMGEEAMVMAGTESRTTEAVMKTTSLMAVIMTVLVWKLNEDLEELMQEKWTLSTLCRKQEGGKRKQTKSW